MSRTRPPHLVLVVLLTALALPACGAKSEGTSSGLPEDNFTYAISHFSIPRNPDNPLDSVRHVIRAMEELREGVPFDEVAVRSTAHLRGPDGPVPAGRGWMGFMRPERPEPLTGAWQAVQPGQFGGPIEQNQASHFIYRHTFDEGRRIEADVVIPAYGFIIPNDPNHPDPELRDVRDKAIATLEKIKRGEQTFAEASEEYGVSTPRSDAFMENLRDVGPRAALYELLKDVKPGAVAPLGELEGAFLLARRGVHFRSHVRHILVQHVESNNRSMSVSRSKDEARALADQILQRLRDGELTWEEAVPRYSDEIGTVPLHGWIGAITNGDLIPEFEAAILATEPGQLATELLESGDGFHVIYRVN